MAEDIQALIRKAYLVARQKGKPDWRRMSIAVLKNRLLHLTNNEFSEEKLGFPNFQTFVLAQTELLSLDSSTYPPTAELIDAGDIGKRDEPQSHVTVKQVRPDLWQAILDFSSGVRYGWDPATGEARPILPGESIKKLPTVTDEDLTLWRKEFSEQHVPTLVPSARLRVERWQQQGLATAYLPKPLRRPWVEELIARVHARLTEWFNAENLTHPEITREITHYHKVQDADAPLTQMRAVAIECIRMMTAKELEEIKFSAAVIARVKASRG